MYGMPIAFTLLSSQFIVGPHAIGGPAISTDPTLEVVSRRSSVSLLLGTSLRVNSPGATFNPINGALDDALASSLLSGTERGGPQ